MTWFELGWVAVALVSASPSKDAWNKPRHLLFGDRNTGWVIYEVRSKEVRHLKFPASAQVEDASVAPDGSAIVFTAYDKQAGNVLLFRWSGVADQPPVRIGDSRGYHAGPSVSPDGKWIYFAHHPFAGGPPGSHGEKAYAQVYKVRLDGTDLAALTDEAGCHLSPVLASARRLFFLHTHCVDGAALVEREASGTETTVTDNAKDFRELAIAPDGKSLLVSALGVESFVLFRFAPGLTRPKQLLGFRRSSARARPGFGAGPDEVLYQNLGKVWSFSIKGQKSSEVASLVEERL